MKKSKKLICFCTALLMVSSLISCNNKKSNTTSFSSEKSDSLPGDADKITNTSKNQEKITTYYDKHVLEGCEDFFRISRIRYSGDKLYVLGQKESEESISWASTDLNTLETVSIQNDSTIQDKSNSAQVCTDKKGNIYECSFEDIKIYDKQHNLTKNIDSEFFAGNDKIKCFDFYSVAVNENGDIFIAVSANTPESIQIIKLNSSFEIQYITEEGELSDCGFSILKMFIGKNGNPVLCTESDITYINEISAESGRTLLRYELPASDEIIGEYGNYSIIYKSDNLIYGYDHLAGKTSEIFSVNKNDSAIMTSYIKDDTLITEMTKIGEISNSLNIYSKNGKLEKSIIIAENYEMSDMSVTDDGTVYLSGKQREFKKTGEMVTESSQYHIFLLNEDGTTEKKYSAEKYFGQSAEGWTLYNFVTDSQGNICVCSIPPSPDVSTMHATYINSSGKQYDITYECSTGISEILCIKDEIYILCCKNNNNQTQMLHINKETHTIDKTTDLAFHLSCLTSGSGENDLLYSSGDEVYGYNIADNSSEKLFSWFDTDVEYIPYDSKNLVIADDDNIFYIDDYSSNYENNTGNPVSVINLKRADKERLKEINNRTLITLAGMNISNNFFTRIKKFNNTDSEYMIVATDYSKYNSLSGEDNSEALRKMEEDIANGFIPDIIHNDSSYDIQQILSKDLFTDLNVFLKNDPEIDSSDLADNFLDACTYNGKLCCFPCRFSLNTFTMPQEYTQDSSVLTYDDFFSFADKFGDSAFINTSRENASISLLSSYINDNVDYVNSTCSFETDVFRKLLQKLKGCVPGELFFSDDYAFNYDSVKDQRFLRISNIDELFYIYFDMKDNNSDHISYYSKGVPSSAGTVSSVDISHSIGITNSSENKDGAWKFIKYYANIKDGCGIWINNTGNPLSIYRSKNQEAINSTISSISEQHDDFDKSDREKLSDTLNSICNGKIISADRYSGIYSIIVEEAENYYNDTQSIEETISAVQKRAGQYLSEISSNN